MDILTILLLLNLTVMVIIGVLWIMLRNKCKEREAWNKQHPDLALIALPLVYIQPYQDGAIIQDSKQRLHYFHKDKGYSWEPLENIEL
jgi:hypothetical protein